MGYEEEEADHRTTNVSKKRQRCHSGLGELSWNFPCESHTERKNSKDQSTAPSVSFFPTALLLVVCFVRRWLTVMGTHEDTLMVQRISC